MSGRFASGGRLFGDAGGGLRWQYRSDRPSWHPSDCMGPCCWRTVPDPHRRSRALNRTRGGRP